MSEPAGKAAEYNGSAPIQLKPCEIDAHEDSHGERHTASGLKHTNQEQVDALPTNWSCYELQQVCRHAITYGIVQCGPHVRDGVPYVRVSDMDCPELDVDRMLRTSATIAAKFSRSAVEEGDLVYALRGKLGEVRQVRGAVAGANLTQGTAKLSPNERIASGYLLWAMRNPRSVRQAEVQAKGTTFREITLAELRRIEILVPPVPEQRAIVAALSDVNALTGALDRLIAKKRDLKQAAMQQLLTGQTRLPGFKGAWEPTLLGDLFTFRNGLNKAKEFFGSGTPIVNYMDVHRGLGLTAACIRGRVTLTPQELKAFDVRKGDVFFTRTSETVEEIGLTDVMLEDYSHTVFSGFLLRARPKDNSLVDTFKKYCFRSHAIRRQITSRASYTTRALTNGRLLSLVVLLRPAVDEQAAIASVLSDMDTEITALEQRRDKTRLLKQGMMQDLLTGRSRLV